jgi:ribosomal protein RSM22 (predicted rRNA methylase)
MGQGLPEELAQAVQRLAAGRSRAALAERAAEISGRYRERAPSSGLIAAPEDVVAYVLSRLPATYAAVARVLGELQERAPEFRPAEVLDAGAGPGTASWAAAEAWPELASITMVDHNPQFLEAARILSSASASEALSRGEVLQRNVAGLGLDGRQFDLVVAGYAMTELAEDALPGAVERLWQHCRGALVIVEPGRARDYQRLMAVREQLAAAGAQVVAPCPHQGACPLAAPDWCHFSVRLPRSRDHMRVKGGSLGYEDEKFSYLVVARPGIGARPAPARVIGPPAETKFSVTLPLCGADGAESRVVASRDRPAFKAARKLRWGDTT